MDRVYALGAGKDLKKKLHDAATNAVFKQYHTVEGGTHNDTWLKGGKDYIYVLKDFLEKCN